MDKLSRTIPVTRPYKLPLESNKWGGAYFDGLTGYINVLSNSNFQITGDLTVHILTRPLRLNASNDIILECGAAGETLATNVLYRVGTSAFGKLRGFHEFGLGTDVVIGPTAKVLLDLNKLHHISYVRDDTVKTYTFYTDGIFRESIAYADSASGGTSDEIIIGHSLSLSTSYYEGIVYEAVVIASKLTQPQVQDLMYGRIIPTQFDCRVWHDYRLGHARDLSGNNNGTVIGNVRFV